MMKKKKESEVFFLLGLLFPRKRDLRVREKRNLACLKTFFFFFLGNKEKELIEYLPKKKKLINNATSDQARLPAELKHINKRRKRN